MKNNFVCELQLPFEIDTTGVYKVIESYKDLHQYMIFPYSREWLDPNLLTLIDSLGYYISHQEMFYTPPKGKLPIHVDQYTYSNMSKLNWIFGGPGSNVWWKAKDPKAQLKYYTTPIGTQYIYFEEHEVDEIYRYPVHTSTFFNAGQPHSVDNTSDEGRWCLSHCISSKKTRNMIEMPEVHQVFADYIKN
ncbi:hypothetical protein EB001_04525 [bacterium]|nr:hypothetical protein [bacterium]